jgi:type I restriction enzyme, R subunit
MSSPGEYKTVQSRNLAYAQEIGRLFVSRAEAERRCGFDPDGGSRFRRDLHYRAI